jgi:hypothetical protein
MLESLVAALNEPEGEFVRLYEIRDAIATHFGSDGEARNRLDLRPSFAQSATRVRLARSLDCSLELRRYMSRASSETQRSSKQRRHRRGEQRNRSRSARMNQPAHRSRRQPSVGRVRSWR